VNFLDRFPDFFGRKERALYRIARQSKQCQPNQMGAGAYCSLQSRIAPSIVSTSYNVRNRTSMTQSRPIIAFSK
jgi:predicted HAD superfamily phosphohydrolase